MKKLIALLLVCAVFTGCVTLPSRPVGGGASSNISGGGYGNDSSVRERDYFSYSADKPKTEDR
jgi:hypothetical protein